MLSSRTKRNLYKRLWYFWTHFCAYTDNHSIPQQLLAPRITYVGQLGFGVEMVQRSQEPITVALTIVVNESMLNEFTWVELKISCSISWGESKYTQIVTRHLPKRHWGSTAQTQGQAQTYARFVLLDTNYAPKNMREIAISPVSIDENTLLNLWRVCFVEKISILRKANRVTPSPWFVCEVWRLLQTTQYPVHSIRTLSGLLGRTLVPRRQGFRHSTRNECTGLFAQI